MTKKTLPRVILLVAIIMMIINLLQIDLDKLTDLKLNLSPYLGVLSAFLIALSMFLTIKKMEKKIELTRN